MHRPYWCGLHQLRTAIKSLALGHRRTHPAGGGHSRFYSDQTGRSRGSSLCGARVPFRGGRCTRQAKEVPTGAPWSLPLRRRVGSTRVEAFESFVAVALEAEGLVVSSGVKFPVTLQTRRADHQEVQTHGYEVDLVGARADRLILATVKSYLGSRGVVAEHVTGETTNEQARRRYLLLNHAEIRRKVVKEAVRVYGYRMSQVELRLRRLCVSRSACSVSAVAAIAESQSARQQSRV